VIFQPGDNPTNYQITSAFSAPPSRTQPFRWTLDPQSALRSATLTGAAQFSG
jgi:hypothetical protein